MDAYYTTIKRFFTKMLLFDDPYDSTVSLKTGRVCDVEINISFSEF